MRKISNEKGFTLVELLVALTILSVIVFAILAIFAQYLNYSVNTGDKITATNLAEKVLYYVSEEIKEELEADETDPNDYDQFMELFTCGNAFLDKKKFLIEDPNLVREGDDYYYQVNNKKFFVDVEVCREDTFKYVVNVKMSILDNNVKRKIYSGRQDIVVHFEEG
ncbi:hypothetical protein UACE39S_05325 [Ureibacillus acetophenoni]